MLTTLVFATLVLNNFQSAQAKARDTQRITRVNAIHSKLEEFYNEANGYPADASIATNFPGIDINTVKDPEGGLIKSILVADSAAMDSVEVPSAGSGNELTYVAYPKGCTMELKSGSYTGIPCKGYTLSSYLEKPSSIYRNPYVKTGLQNP
jgi:type II secretory pathway pseudopilin PulG